MATESLTTPVTVTLFDFDLSKYDTQGGDTHIRITSNLDTDRSKISYEGNEYDAVPIDISGQDIRVTGTYPRPKITISNVAGTYNALLFAFADFLNAPVTVKVVRYDYLDGKKYAGLGGVDSYQKYRVNTKFSQNNKTVSFELRHPLDLENYVIPSGIISHECSHTYRIFKNGAFVYGTCPYAGGACFDRYGNQTSQDKDACGKTVTSCEKRFNTIGVTENIPFRGVPLACRI